MRIDLFDTIQPDMVDKKVDFFYRAPWEMMGEHQGVITILPEAVGMQVRMLLYKVLEFTLKELSKEDRDALLEHTAIGKLIGACTRNYPEEEAKKLLRPFSANIQSYKPNGNN